MSSLHATQEVRRNVSDQSRAHHSTERADVRWTSRGSVAFVASTLVAAVAVVVTVVYPAVTAATATTAFGAFAAVQRASTDGSFDESPPTVQTGDSQPSESVVSSG